MFDRILKKKFKIGGGGGKKDDEDSEEINTPDAKDAVDDIDAALAKAEATKKEEVRREKQRKEEQERARLREIERSSGCCACGCR